MNNACLVLPDSGIRVCADPYEAVAGARAVPILTECSEFEDLDLYEIKKQMAQGLIFDILGCLPTVDMPSFCTGARVCLYPSLKETFGKPLVETTHCGVPV